jgi:uncharacterized membrane protein
MENFGYVFYIIFIHVVLPITGTFCFFFIVSCVSDLIHYIKSRL